MKLVLPNQIAVECNTEEFLELYPKLMNGHAKPATTIKETFNDETCNKVLNKISESNLKEWDRKDLVKLTGLTPYECSKAMNQAIKEGTVKKVGRQTYIFSNGLIHNHNNDVAYEMITKIMRR